MADAVPPRTNLIDLRLGSYRLLEALGSGGMSSVFRAVHEPTGLEVAVKVLPRYLAKNPILLQRFSREAQSAESLDHPNIASIYDRGSQQGRHYIVLEYVPGPDLHDLVKAEGPLSVLEAVRIIEEAAEGLRYAAGRGVIHRDIKPANLLWTPEGHVKLIDLGLALQANEEEDERVTRDGTTVGTVDYMAPEQGRDSRAASVRSDIYSLGCTFYYLLTGRPPFPGGDIADKLGRHARQPPPEVRVIRPDVPAALAGLIHRMMAKKPEDRFDDYDALIQALRALSLGAPEGQAGLDEAIIDDEDEADFELGPGAVAVSLNTTTDSAPVRDSSEILPEPEGVQLAELAELMQDEADEETHWSASEPNQVPTSSFSQAEAPEAALEGELQAELEAELLEESSEESLPQTVPARQSGASGFDPTWLLAGVAGVLALVVLTVGIVRSLATTERVESVDPDLHIAEAERLAPPIDRPDPRPPAPIQPRITPPPDPEQLEPLAEQPTRVPRPEPVPEPSFSPEVEQRFSPPTELFAFADAKPADPVVRVRRLGSTSLRQALESLEAKVVELNDTGPFFEGDPRTRGAFKIIRAREGTRSIVVIDRPSGEVYREATSVYNLEDRTLVLEELDLIVPLARLPRTRKALFQCRNTRLVLRDCTVTIVGANPQRPFSLVHVDDGDEGTSRIQLERTFVRGTVGPVFDCRSGPEALDLNRAVIVGGSGPVVTIGRRLTPEPRLWLRRSVTATSSPLLAFTHSIDPNDSEPVEVSALGSWFVRIPGPGVSSVIDSNHAADEAIDLEGVGNVALGWASWVAEPGSTAGASGPSRSFGDDWAPTEIGRLEQASPLTMELGLSDFSLAELAAAVPELASTLEHVARPRPFLNEKTIGRFERYAAPPAPGRPEAGAERVPGRPEGDVAGLAPEQAAGKAPGPGSVHEVSFDMSATPWHGDLGAFVNQLAQESQADRLRVRVSGTPSSGRSAPMRPIVLDNRSLEIVVAPSAQRQFWWITGGRGDSTPLFDVRGGDLVLIGVSLQRGVENQAPMVRLENGHLLVQGSRFHAAHAQSGEGAPLLVFLAPDPEPIAPRPGSPAPNADLPIARLVDCIVMSNRDAVRAELARGVLALQNCALAATGSGITLARLPAPADRFRGELWLDRCTLASETAIVDVPPVVEPSPDPDRPWLISSVASLFLDDYQGQIRLTPALLVDEAEMARGNVIWQGARDAFELALFTAERQNPPQERPMTSYRLDWLKLWGPNRVSVALAPQPRESIPKYNRLQPGGTDPSTLFRPGHTATIRGTSDVGADPGRLGLNLP